MIYFRAMCALRQGVIRNEAHSPNYLGLTEMKTARRHQPQLLHFMLGLFDQMLA
jgi:hypothetical protein